MSSNNIFKDFKKTIPNVLSRSFREFPNNNFLGFSDDTPYTYSDVKRLVENVNFNLERLNIKPGDKVAILSSNMPNWGVAYYSILSMGAVVVPILPDFSEVEIKNILEHSEAKVLFVGEFLVPKVAETTTSFLHTIIKTNDFSVLRSDLIDSFDYDSSLESSVEVEEKDLALLIYTSGTTGTSKGVMLSHLSISLNTIGSYGYQNIVPDDVFLSLLPLSHAYENTLGLNLPMFYGASVYYLRKLPTPAVLLPAMKKIRPTIMLSVPLIIEKIYRNKILQTFNSNFVTKNLYKLPVFSNLLNKLAGKKLFKLFGGRLKFFGIGGAKINEKVEKFLIDAKFPYAIGYGLTETAPLVAGTVVGKPKLGSTGNIMPGIEMQIVNKNEETGEGEIMVKSDMVMMGYYKQPEATKEVLTDDGWFKTGDLAVLDKKNRIFIRGRSKNVIVGSSGENIYPEEIESVINNFDFVLDSLVVESTGGKLVAMVHLNMEELEAKYMHMKENFEDKVELYKSELIEYINSKVNKFSLVKAVAIQYTPFEKTPTHKIKRYKYQGAHI